ncbi:MAG: alanine dehydrogenase [Gammaproteobacteria bacterium]|nr:alanine dehydrogenase [Gammaproteobacteria bacterium]MDH5801879.1 alanine dehydrogenase [Gammaproteobacteria bacterium]
MQIGIPSEVKTLEGRVALIPEAAGELVKQGHEVFIQRGAGKHSGYSDDDYEAVGLSVVENAQVLFEKSRLIVKVKEPQAQELSLFRRDHILFSYLHLAAELPLMEKLQAIGLTAIAFETVETADGRLPLLAPMSDIAGRIAVQVGATLLHRPQGGKGLLLGGLPAAPRGQVVILGAGVAGGNAALLAAGMGANVTVFDRNRDKLEAMRRLGANVTALYPYQASLKEAVRQADLLIGAVLVTGERAPHLVDAEMVKSMQAGSVIIDISVDQGGCIETTKPTNYKNPTFLWENVVHFGVTNMPGAVPRSASQALSAAILPYVSALGGPQWRDHAELSAGINVKDGEILHPALKLVK